MSIRETSQSIRGISGKLDSQTISTMERAAAVQAKADALSRQAIEVALANMQSAFSASNYASGIKTEKDLLGKGMSLAA